MTVWRPVPGWPEYEISRNATVRSIDRTVTRRDGRPYRVRGRVLRHCRHRGWHALSVTLSRPGEKTRAYVGVLVAEVFGPPPTTRTERVEKENRP